MNLIKFHLNKEIHTHLLTHPHTHTHFFLASISNSKPHAEEHLPNI